MLVADEPCRGRDFLPETSLTAGNLTLALLDRHTLGEVARLVDIGAFEDGDVVSQELDRDRVEERSDKRITARHRDAKGEAIGEAGDAGRIRDHHNAPAAGHDL